MNFKMLKREIMTEHGIEIVVEKKHNLFKDQWKDRLWVFQPQDPVFKQLDNKLKQQRLW